MNKKKNEDDQKKRALILFLMLTAVFLGCLVFLMGIQYEWWKWVQDLTKEQYESFEPLTWMLASLIGASLYLMGQIATYFPKINEKPDPDNQNDFVRSTYWYASTLFRAPVLTVVIMWLLTHLSVGVGGDVDSTPAEDLGLSLDFSKFPDIVNLGIAFILGFYGRVARKQLDILAKYLFTRAWALAELGFDISSTVPDEVLLGETHTFKTEPKMDVVWVATLGDIGSESGVYTAPSKAEDYDKNDVILAYLRSEPTSTHSKQVKLKLFRIIGDSEAAPETSVTLKLDKKLSKLDDQEIKLATAEWKCDAANIFTVGKNTGESITFTTPKEEKDLPIAVIYKVGTDDNAKTYEAKFTLKVVKPK